MTEHLIGFLSKIFNSHEDLKQKSLYIINKKKVGYIDPLQIQFEESKKNSKEFFSVRRTLQSKEHKVRLILERMFFPAKFKNIRLKHFINPFTNKRLELDCYNALLNLAVEVQGQQHYKFIKYFHGNEGEFKKQQERDMIKRLLCKEHGIKLIEIPFNISESKVEQYLLNQISFIL